jgi:hypothetical protein
LRACLALAAVGGDLAEVQADQVGLRMAGFERAREVQLGGAGSSSCRDSRPTA